MYTSLQPSDRRTQNGPKGIYACAFTARLPGSRDAKCATCKWFTRPTPGSLLQKGEHGRLDESLPGEQSVPSHPLQRQAGRRGPTCCPRSSKTRETQGHTLNLHLVGTCTKQTLFWDCRAAARTTASCSARKQAAHNGFMAPPLPSSPSTYSIIGLSKFCCHAAQGSCSVTLEKPVLPHFPFPKALVLKERIGTEELELKSKTWPNQYAILFQFLVGAVSRVVVVCLWWVFSVVVGF